MRRVVSAIRPSLSMAPPVSRGVRDEHWQRSAQPSIARMHGRHENASELEHGQGLGLVAARAAPAAGCDRGRARHHRQRGLRPGGHARRAAELLEAQAEAAGLPLHVLADPPSLPQRGLRAHHGRVRGRSRPPPASRPWPSATCSWRTSAAIARPSSPAPGSRRCFRCGASTPERWRAR